MASDIVLTCDALAVTAQGVPLPSASLNVQLNAPITSRVYANGWSEALLTVDEPNSGLPGFATTQLACADPNGICTVPGTGGSSNPFDGSAGRPNVFVGRVSGNTVTFPGVPLDGTRRIYRVTNLRVNAASVAPRLYGVQTPLVANLSFSNGLAIDQGTNLTVGYVGHSIELSLRSPDGSTAANLPGFAVSQCNTPQRVATFRALQIQFDWGMMKRSFAAYVDSETSPPPMIMGVPGVVYYVETTFYNPAMSAPTVDFATVGLADAGTRIRGAITNVPPGPKCS